MELIYNDKYAIWEFESKKVIILQHVRFYEQLKCHVKLSWALKKS